MMRIMKTMIMRSNPMKVITTALFLFVCLVLLLQRKRMGNDTIFSTLEAWSKKSCVELLLTMAAATILLANNWLIEWS